MKAPVVITAGGVNSNAKRKKRNPKNKLSLKTSIDESGNDSTPPSTNSRLNTPADSSIDPTNGASDRSLDDSTKDIAPGGEGEDDETEVDRRRLLQIHKASVRLDDLYSSPPLSTQNITNEATQSKTSNSEYFWLAFCFFGIMGSFVAYGLLLEFATSGGKHLHELSFLFVTSLLYTMTASVGRYARAEKPSTIPPAQFAVLGLTSMGSTFFSVRALRYVIYPIQVLAKSCKPVPVMLMGALMGKKYPIKKYIKVVFIVGGVGLFMGGGDKKKDDLEDDKDASSQLIGVTLLFISLCFDGGTGAYEDKLMSVHSVGPFDLMYNIQLGKTILAGIGLIVLNQVHVFAQMCQDMGFLLVALGLSGAVGQVFIFVTIAKFGALTCSIIGLARKVTTLVASIYFYGHHLNSIQALGLFISVGAMSSNFFDKKKGGGGHGDGSHGVGGKEGKSRCQTNDDAAQEEATPMLPSVEECDAQTSAIEMGNFKR
mmetsp:Transcript_22125/g.52283  ORF Transcript_22125/g.52283 Transcript_22125/m.52283 type:complete len:485 (+) Transcript_22125:117-1571(+)